MPTKPRAATQTPKKAVNPASQTAPKKTKEYGIKELSEVILLCASFIYALSRARGVDGRFHWRDSLKFLGSIKRIPDAVNGIDQVPLELKDLDEQELEELHKLIDDNFNLRDENKEAKIKELLDGAFKVLAIFIKF